MGPTSRGHGLAGKREKIDSEGEGPAEAQAMLGPEGQQEPPTPALTPTPGPGKSPLHPGSSTHTVFMANGFGPDMKANFFLVSLEEYILPKASVSALTQMGTFRVDVSSFHSLPCGLQQGLPVSVPPFSPSQIRAPFLRARQPCPSRCVREGDQHDEAMVSTAPALLGPD